MSANLVPLNGDGGALEPSYAPSHAYYVPPTQHDSGEEQGGSISVARILSALRRYRWLILAVTILGVSAGYAATRLLKPEYSVAATIWITSETPLADNRRTSGQPIRSSELLASAAWIELLKSFTIADQVVTQMRLYVQPNDKADSAAFADFEVTETLRPGDFSLDMDGRGRWTLSILGDGVRPERRLIERGAAGDSIGRSVGFAWAPSAERLGRAARSIPFRVTTPREASAQLITRVNYAMAKQSNFLLVRLDGEDSRQTAATMNSWIREFVAKAADMKKRNLVEFSRTLQLQLEYAQKALASAEHQLQTFRINTITQPREGSVGIAAGLVETTNPALDAFFKQKEKYETVRQDREALERFLEGTRRGEIRPDAVVAVSGAIAQGRGNDLKGALDSLTHREAALRAARLYYTDEHRTVKDLQAGVEQLRSQTIPQLASDIVGRMRAEEDDLSRRIAASSRELQQIPTRTIEEMRLTRNVEVAEELFKSLRKNYEEAKLAEASALPDVAILDTAVAPLQPTNTTNGAVLLLGALAGGLGLGIVLAVLLDRLDRRFRYPDQVSKELGLEIIGAVPTIRKLRNARKDEEERAQVVEAFRSLRLNLHHAFQGVGPITFTVSSAGAGDGKSLIASNLALSFADAGYRTLLVDGDVRRGGLHEAFDVNAQPGLMEYLAGQASRDEVVRASQHDNLSIVPTGLKRRQGPELLASREMMRFVDELRAHFDVIIVDSPPLGAGIDPFALGAVTGNLLLVFRSGATDRVLAKAKLAAMSRFPIRPLGAVLNGIEADGVYRNYSYLAGYGAEEMGVGANGNGDGHGTPQLGPRVGEVNVGS